MSLIIDASVAYAWFADEPGCDAARAILASGEPLFAPTLILAEVGNAFWKSVKRDTPMEERSAIRRSAARAMVRLPTMLSETIALQGLAERACDLAFALGHPVYDCCYLALAEQRAAPLVTANRRLLDRLAKSDYANLARAL